jgi:replicative superfamily II helicase
MVFRENERARQQQQLQAAGSRAAQQASTLPPVQKRVIYTAPIKALSNQKYREFKVNMRL